MKKLNNLNILRKQSKSCDLNTLEEIVDKLASVIKERKEEEQLIFERYIEKQNKIDKIIDLMRAEGLSPKDLVNR